MRIKVYLYRVSRLLSRLNKIYYLSVVDDRMKNKYPAEIRAAISSSKWFKFAWQGPVPGSRTSISNAKKMKRKENTDTLLKRKKRTVHRVAPPSRCSKCYIFLQRECSDLPLPPLHARGYYTPFHFSFLSVLLRFFPDNTPGHDRCCVRRHLNIDRV